MVDAMPATGEGTPTPGQPLSEAARSATITRREPAVQTQQAEPAGGPLQSDGTADRATFDALVQQHPWLTKHIEESLVRPAVSKRDEVAAKRAERTGYQRGLSEASRRTQNEQLAELVKAVANSPDENAKRLAGELNRMLSAQVQTSQQDQLRHDAAAGLLSEVFGVDAADAPDDVFTDPAAFRRYVLENSKSVQDWRNESAGTARANAAALSQVERAAAYGERLTQTPNPSLGTGAGVGPVTAQSFEEIERRYNEGTATFEDYFKAREARGLHSHI